MAGAAVVVFELGREKNPAVQSGGGKQVADEALGAAIGGCRVDQGSAPATKVFNASAQALRCVGSSPTSNTCEVPSPIPGSISPECRIGRAINPDVPVSLA